MRWLCLLALSLLTSPAFADGLAMHGAPKYDATATHLEYANPNASKGETLKQAAIGTFDTLNPYNIQGKAAAGLNLFYDRLSVRVWDEPFTLYPLIAETLEMPEDRSSLSLTINPKARFHDDSPVTIDDVLFSFETLKASGRPNMRAVYKLVEDVSVNDNTITFTFGEGFDQETGMIIAMMPVLSKAWWEDSDFNKTTLEIPNGNGPYRIKDFDPGRRIIYERDPDYWATDHFASIGHYNFDTVIYDYFRDSNVAFEAFKAGDLSARRESDITKWNSGYEGFEDQQHSITHGRPERTRGFIFNTRRAPFDNIQVREALGLLFDFEWVNKNLFGGSYKRIESIYPNSELSASGEATDAELALLPENAPTSAFTAPFNDTPRAIRQNRIKAGELLNTAGWVVQDGKRMKDGAPLEFEILLDNPSDEKIALHFQRALEREGITMQIRVLDSAAFRGRLNEYDFDMASYFWQSSLSPGTEQLLYWSCAAAEEAARWNFPGICDPSIDTIAGNIANTKTREDLITHTRALDRLIMNGHYFIPLYYSGADYFALNPAMRYPENTALYGAVMETWWMDPRTP